MTCLKTKNIVSPAGTAGAGSSFNSRHPSVKTQLIPKPTTYFQPEGTFQQNAAPADFLPAMGYWLR